MQRRIPGPAAQRLIRVIAFVAAFAMFLVHSEEYLEKFEHPLCFANLLYVDDGIAKCAAAAAQDGGGLRRALMQSDRVFLNDAFRHLIIGLAQSLAIACSPGASRGPGAGTSGASPRPFLPLGSTSSCCRWIMASSSGPSTIPALR